MNKTCPPSKPNQTNRKFSRPGAKTQAAVKVRPPYRPHHPLIDSNRRGELIKHMPGVFFPRPRSTPKMIMP